MEKILEFNNTKYEVAIIKKRILAFIVDIVIVSIVSISSYLVLYFSGEKINFNVIFSIFFLLTNSIAVIISKGITIGDNFLRLTPIDVKTGNSLSSAKYFFRTLIYSLAVSFTVLYPDNISIVLMFLVFVLVIFFPPNNKYNQTLWDFVTQAVVIEKKNE